MESLRLRQIIWATFTSILAANYPSNSLLGLIREKEVATSQIMVHTSREGCTVELDDIRVGKSDPQGVFTLAEVEPTDHYIHVQCPGQDEMAFFVSPRPDQELEIHPGSAGSIEVAPAASPIEAAQAKIHLRQLIQDAIQLRAKGHLELAVQHLRDAATLDPSNSDLHRELGITFLLVKEWKRARVEMLEAIRHEPDDADAHNGLGYALEKLGQTDAALREYRIATRLDPDDLSYRQHYIDAMSKMAGDQAGKKK
jgi:tetratricopeptide (TPR) repeat protein